MISSCCLKYSLVAFLIIIATTFVFYIGLYIYLVYLTETKYATNLKRTREQRLSRLQST